jgi:hypothetical protein
VALSEFFLFRYIKGRLPGTEFGKKDGCPAAVRGILNGMADKVLKPLFLERENRQQTGMDVRYENVE